MDADFIGGLDIDGLMHPSIPEGKWVSADGRVWNIRDMETSHIYNTVRLLKRLPLLDEWTEDKIEELTDELQKRIKQGDQQ